MREPGEIESTYLAFETNGGSFAIHINETVGVVIGDGEMRPLTLPRTPDFVKCVVSLEGQLTTIITLPGEDGDGELIGKPILLLDHSPHLIGIIVKSVRLVTIPKESITVNRLTGVRTYAEGSDIFSVVDTEILLGGRKVEL